MQDAAEQAKMAELAIAALAKLKGDTE